MLAVLTQSKLTFSLQSRILSCEDSLHIWATRHIPHAKAGYHWRVDLIALFSDESVATALDSQVRQILSSHLSWLDCWLGFLFCLLLRTQSTLSLTPWGFNNSCKNSCRSWFKVSFPTLLIFNWTLLPNFVNCYPRNVIHLLRKWLNVAW